MGDTRWDKRDLKATVLASALVRILYDGIYTATLTHSLNDSFTHINV